MRLRSVRPILVVGALLLSLLTLDSCSTTRGQGLAGEASREKKTHPNSNSSEPEKKDETPAPPPRPTVTIFADPPQARIWVDGQLQGTRMVVLDSGGFGRRVEIRVEAPSHRTKTFSLNLWGQTESLSVELDPILGTLSIQGKGVEDARLLLNSTSVHPGNNRVLIGDSVLMVRRFGFADQSQTVSIEEDKTTEVELAFLPLDFDLVSLTSDRPDGFNPDSAAIAANLGLKFSATGPGHALLLLLDAQGLELRRWEYPNLTTWNQIAQWDGKTLGGKDLPDGRYQVVLTGGEAPGVETVRRELSVRIDRSTIDLDRASIGPGAGLLWVPLPEVMSPGTLQFSSLLLSHVESDLSHTAISNSLRFSPAAAWELFGQASIRAWNDPSINSLYGTFSVKRRIDLDATGFRAAWLVGTTFATYLEGDAEIPPTDFLTTFPALKVAFPASWTWGRWTLALAPEVDGSWWSPASAYRSALSVTEGWRVWGYARAGLSFDPGPVSFGLSGVARTGVVDHGMQWFAPANLGLEARWPMEGTPLTLSGYLSVSAYSTDDYAWYGGVGLSFLIPPQLALDLASQVSTSP